MSKYLILNFSRSTSGKSDWFAPGYRELVDREILAKFYARVSGESDRGLVIVTAALLDDLTEQKLRALFSHGNNEAREHLFDALGPFSSSASKTDALFCLGKMNTENRNNLHIIRKLRNYCAHHWDDFHLEDKVVDERFLSNLALPEWLTKFARDTSSLPLHPRSKFTAVAFMLVLCLNIDKRSENA